MTDKPQEGPADGLEFITMDESDYFKKLVAKAALADEMAGALLWAKEFFEARDAMNAKVHCSPIRWSPITERARMAWEAYDRLHEKEKGKGTPC